MRLPPIPTSEELLNKAFSRARKAASAARTSRIPSQKKAKTIEIIRIQTACNIIKDKLKLIIERTPDIESLPEFYQDYVDVTVGIDPLKKSLGAINWAAGIISQLEREYRRRIRKSRPSLASSIRREAYGRISSVIKKIGDDLDFLDFTRNKLKNMPTVDFDAFTVVIAGFPNVGKSTILRRLTGAKPKVAEYPFTTKGIQIGYLQMRWNKIQVIDTPGLLDRPIDEMNNIELKAMVALENLADIILFIFDASETCGYPMESQYNLFEDLKKIFKIPFICVFNKMDLIENIKYIKKYTIKVEDPILISALEDEGVSRLIKRLEDFLHEKKIRKTIRHAGKKKING